MNDVIKLKTTSEIEEEAAAWVWKLDDDAISAADRKGFEDWVRRDPRHRRAFDELGGVWNALDGLAEAKRAEKIANFTQLSDAPRHLPARSRAWRAVPYAVAATLVVSLAVFWGLRHGNEAQTLATAVGQQRTVSLADGSTVYLNTNTILETRLDGEQRRIRLVKGEALFKVAQDRQRPFFVQVGATVVRAIGTEFNVRMRDVNNVEVVVAEGRVAVTPSSLANASKETPSQGSSEESITLDAGQRLETIKRSSVIALNSETLSKTLAWREGAIVFDGEPLGQAVVEINRYTDTRLMVDDPQILQMKVGGRFKAGDVDEFLLALKRALPVTTRRAGDSLVYIEAETR